MMTLDLTVHRSVAGAFAVSIYRGGAVRSGQSLTFTGCLEMWTRIEHLTFSFRRAALTM
jgi:hypothetical protein